MDRDNAITVVIPVGPYAANKRWLGEAVESCREQPEYLAEILLIDDMADVSWEPILWPEVRVESLPWRVGVATAFNFGVALARSECVFFMGSDDHLLPDCLSECWAAYEENRRQDAYYAVGVQYSDETPDQFLPCNAAMTTKKFWRRTGGFPLEAASGAPDAAFISILLSHDELPDPIIVNGDRPLYWHRSHDESDTAKRGPWQPVILQTRDLLSRLWVAPTW